MQNAYSYKFKCYLLTIIVLSLLAARRGLGQDRELHQTAFRGGMVSATSSNNCFFVRVNKSFSGEAGKNARTAQLSGTANFVSKVPTPARNHKNNSLLLKKRVLIIAGKPHNLNYPTQAIGKNKAHAVLATGESIQITAIQAKVVEVLSGAGNTNQHNNSNVSAPATKLLITLADALYSYII